MDIGRRYWTFRRIGTGGVGLAHHLPAANAASRKHHAVASRPMVAAGVLVDLRRAAEVTHPDDQCAIEEPTFLQVIQQRGVSLLHWRHQCVFEPVEIILVRVPSDARTIVGGHEARAAFNQPTREQVRLPPRVSAIAFAHLGRFLRQVKSFRRLA